MRCVLGSRLLQNNVQRVPLLRAAYVVCGSVYCVDHNNGITTKGRLGEDHFPMISDNLSLFTAWYDVGLLLWAVYPARE